MNFEDVSLENPEASSDAHSFLGGTAEMISKCGDYSIWCDLITDSEGNETIRILVTDGERIWDSTVVQGEMPPARRSQKWVDYLSLLLSVLRSENMVGIDYSHDFEVEGTHLTLSIIEHVGGANLKSLLIRKIMQQCVDSKGAMNKLLGFVAGAMKKKEDDIKLLHDTESKLTLSMGHLTRDLNNLIDDKERIETDMLRKMCLLLNSKSSEILYLRSKISKEDSNNESDVCSSAKMIVAKPVTLSESSKVNKRAKSSSSSPSPSRHVVTDIAEKISDFDELKVPLHSTNMTLIDCNQQESSAMKSRDKCTDSTEPLLVLKCRNEPCSSNTDQNTSTNVGYGNADNTINLLNEGPRTKKKKRKLCESSDDSDNEQTPLKV